MFSRSREFRREIPAPPTSPGRPSTEHGAARKFHIVKVAAITASVLCGQAPALVHAAAPGTAATQPTAQTPPTSKPQGWLGIMLGDGSRESLGAGQDGPSGIAISGVVADGPARRAGLRARDRILAVDGNPVNTPAQLIALVKSLSPDDWATFSIRRGDRTMDIKAFLQERPDNAGQLHMLEGYVGAEGIDLTPELREHFGAPREAGVMISRIAEGSPAEIAGLLVGDVVFEVDGEPMRSGGMLRAALDGGGVDNRVEVRLVRDGAKITIEPLVVVRPDREDRADD